MKAFDYHRPTALGEAFRLAGECPGARYIAGGTDLLVRIRAGRERPEALISLGRVEALAGIALGQSTRIGARATIGDLLRHRELVQSYPLLDQAARPFASAQVRNLATVAGNLCNASPAADMAPVLLALDARVTVEGPTGSREVALDAFFTGPGLTTLAPGELVTAIVLDAPHDAARSCFLRQGRVGMDIALTSVAVHYRLVGRRIEHVRIAAGAVAPRPIRLRAVEEFLEGREVTNGHGAALVGEAARLAASEIAPITDIRASAGYRRRLTGTLLARALTATLERGVA
jgi:carbon-monoxide dehydrogenase medium subunit